MRSRDISLTATLLGNSRTDILIGGRNLDLQSKILKNSHEDRAAAVAENI
jgi:hypothetical protein